MLQATCLQRLQLLLRHLLWLRVPGCKRAGHAKQGVLQAIWCPLCMVCQVLASDDIKKLPPACMSACTLIWLSPAARASRSCAARLLAQEATAALFTHSMRWRLRGSQVLARCKPHRAHADQCARCDLQLGAHPMFKGLWDRTASLRKSKVVEKGRHLREDLRERWETADNRVVHKIQVCAATWRCLRGCRARSLPAHCSGTLPCAALSCRTSVTAGQTMSSGAGSSDASGSTGRASQGFTLTKHLASQGRDLLSLLYILCTNLTTWPAGHQ